MSLYTNSGLTAADVAEHLYMTVSEDTSVAFDDVLRASCSDIEPYVKEYAASLVPDGLKRAILDWAATLYERRNTSVQEVAGNQRTDYGSDTKQLMGRIGAYRKMPYL